VGREICRVNSKGENILKFQELSLKGVFLIELEKIEDERGFFSRVWDKKKFEDKGLNSNLSQCNISFNKNKGTIRGMHFQKKPYEEAKIIRCVKGKIFEVLIDIRVGSPTFHKWISVELCENKYEILYVPEGFALGFQTLLENTELYYQMSEYYHPEKSGGIKWNDPKIQIKWPLDCSVISKKDDSFEPL
jgi:dTDP-4-dehydrorhamnose 3,5-epimerase